MAQWLKHDFELNLNNGFNRDGWERICARDWERPAPPENVSAGKSGKSGKGKKATKRSKESKGGSTSKGGPGGKKRR